MTNYHYVAITAGNETRSGEMEAESADDVVARLRASGLIPLRIRPARWRPRWPSIGMPRRRSVPGARDIADFTEQFANLLQAGFTQDGALRMIAEDEGVPGALAADLRERIRGGATLSQAMEGRSGAFPAAYVRVVEAGEAGGAVATGLQRLHEDLERRRRLRERLVSALIYPMLLVVLAFVALLVLLGFVVPRFMPLFEDLGGEPPLLTRMVMFVGYGLQNWGWLLALVLVAVVLAWRHRLADPRFRRWQDGLLLRMPLAGGLILRAEIARFSRMLGTMVTNGVPLLSSLSLSREVLRNQLLRERIGRAAEAVREGGRLGRTLAEDRLLPAVTVRMIEMGEETGALGAMLLRAADTLERDLHVRIERLMGLLVPVVTLVMAVVIGLIVMSMLLAILDINQLIL